MKQFFKFLFASLIGSFISFIIIVLIFMGIISLILSYSEKDVVVVHPNSLLHITLNQPIADRTSENPLADLDIGDFDLESPPGLNDILASLKKAKTDPNIQGIFLEVNYVSAGIATIQEIRTALSDFKESRKFVIAYGNLMTQGAYYLASIADEIYLNPEGMILFKGLNMEVMFLKKTLEKLDINMQVIRSGKYKSAVEPFLREDLSEDNKEQLAGLAQSVWDELLIAISEARNVSIYDLNLYADNLELSDANSALVGGLVDGVIYKDEMIAILETKLNIPKQADYKSVSLENYIYVEDKAPRKFTRDKIAIIYAQGEISMAGKDDEVVGGERYARIIRKAREDKNVKAIVLRVNSPGGDVLASEIIRREVELAAKEKVLLVSMGDVAASGGYWISCNADKIIADQTTITGSIGVYGMFPDFQSFMDTKLGITFDNVKTNENADFMSVTKALSPYQEAIIRNEIDKTYEKFIALVAEGRNLNVSQVDSIAQGRVWSGSDAKRIGLVDDLGGLNFALNEAAALAEIDNYIIEELPVQKDFLEELFNSSIEETNAKFIKSELGNNYKYYQWIRNIDNYQGVQARLPVYLQMK